MDGGKEKELRHETQRRGVGVWENGKLPKYQAITRTERPEDR